MLENRKSYSVVNVESTFMQEVDYHRTRKANMKLPVISVWLSVLSFGAVCSAMTKEAPADDIFSSISKMEALVHQENAIVDMLDSFLVDAKQRINIIQK